jgi:hypothetical protein
MITWGTVWGCFDNNILNLDVPMSTAPNQFHLITPYGNNQNAWLYQPFSYGTADAFVIEDCTINYTTMFTSDGAAGRYVYRHNTMNYTGGSLVYEVYLIDMHGNDATAPGTGNGNWGGQGVEIYGNTMNMNNSPGGGMNILTLRGGMALVYNNQIINLPTNGVTESYLEEEYLDANNPPAFQAQNHEPQHVNNAYWFQNYKNGSQILNNTRLPWISSQLSELGEYNDTTTRLCPTEDLDFWREVSPFTGTHGCGSGLLANEPASATLLNTGYWATDTNTLYTWNGSAWVVYYTPLAYPHPYRSIANSPLGD